MAALASALSAVALLGWLLRERAPESASRALLAAPPGANVEAAREGPRATPPAGALPPAAAGERSVTRRRDPDKRARARQSADAVRARLRALQERRDSEKQAPGQGSTAAAAAPTTMPPPEGTGNQVHKPLGEYVQRLLKEEFIPLGKDCYQELLERSPNASGSLTMKVVVTGDPAVGGVVDAVDVSSDSELSDETLLTCIRESMYSVQFDAPPPGHPKMDFQAPLTFSPFPPDAGP